MKHYKTNNEIRAIDVGQEFLIQEDWILLTDEELQAIINPPLTVEQIKQQLEQAVQAHIDTKAKELGYDNISSIGKYLGYDNPFRLECEKLGLWNSNCWIKAFEVSKQVEDGLRDIPTVEELITMLPIYGQ